MSMQPQSTQIEAYTQRLEGLETVWWKKLLPVQAPYRWNLRRLKLGLVLERDCSFLFPRPVGKLFIYNEFVVVMRKP